MRLSWRRKRQQRQPGNSPFDADVIRPGDPAWAIFEESLRTGKPVIGTYDATTGEVVSMQTVDLPGDDEEETS